MANSYVWQIQALDCIPDLQGKLNYVVVSHWQCTGSDEGGHSGSVYNTVQFQVDPDKPNYVPYDQLTEAQVITWTQEALGAETVAATEASIDTQIENQVNPPIVQPPLPWASTPPVEPVVEAPAKSK